MPSSSPSPPHRSRRRSIGRWLALGFFALVAVLLVHQARHIDWPAVGTALRGYTAASLLAALALAAVSHALYASYELIGRRLTGHGLPAWRSLTIGAVSYAFNLNLGSLIGGFAARYRFYTNAGLDLAQTTQVIGVSIVTNWFGYFVLAGTLLAWRPLALPPEWAIDGTQLRWLGVAMLVVAASYLAACVIAPNRRWRWRGNELITPSAAQALLQLGLSTANWLTISTLIWFLLGRQLEFTSVAAVFLVAAVAGVIVHVPAGLGVLEAVFVALLSHRVPAADLLAGLIVYRAVYYLAPLVLAGALMFKLERRGAQRVPTPS